jgi:WD40 repeat protein
MYKIKKIIRGIKNVPSYISELAFNPNGSILGATFGQFGNNCGVDDNSVRFYDTKSNKIIKELLKNFFLLKFLKDFDLIKYYTKVQKQFEDSLGSSGREIIADTIKMLPDSDKIGFGDFLNNRNYLSAHGMYISKKKIINSYSEVLFSWFEKCESIINKSNNLPLFKNRRIFQYINERFLDYWMSRNVRTLRWPIAMYNKEKLIITQIGRI